MVLVGRGPEQGQGQAMPKKGLHSRPLSGAGWGQRLRARVARGPVRPCNEFCLHLHNQYITIRKISYLSLDLNTSAPPPVVEIFTL